MSLVELFLNRRTGRVRWVWRLGAFSALFLGTLTILYLMVGPLIGNVSPNAENWSLGDYVMRLLANEIVTIAAALVASGVCMRLFDRRHLRTIGYQFQAGWWSDYLLGTGISLAMLTAVILIGQSVGALSLERHRSPGPHLLGALVLGLLFYNVAAIKEELLFRGYPLQTLLLDLPTVWAIAVPSVIFGLLHLPNPGSSPLSTLNTILAGVWLSVAYWRTGNLWLCTGLHYAWNFVMGPIFGLSVSGLDPTTRTAIFTSQAQGPAWVMGGKYGPEGGAVVTMALLVTTYLLTRTRHPGRTQSPV